jgi:hypothetical protein
MKLESSDIYLRDNLYNIMNGEWDNQFDEEQLEMAKKTSFLFNHITIEERCIIFEYGDKKVKYNFNSDPIDQMYIDFSMHMISIIRNSEDFMNSYKAFLRDWKINKIIE